ncbi:MAG: fumarylacetoacetate hydrolase family protein [Ignavibacteriaceae bacterium]|nr:fumarylacetoacetate hydrolase family protein [Ignavibacteriaceae bacterium]
MKHIKFRNSNKYIAINKIICVGRNYAEHAKELGNEIPEKPVIFLKPASAVIFSGEKIIHPHFSSVMHHEVELLILIGSRIKNANESESIKSISGFGVGLDMTLRDIQDELKKKGHPWTIAKCFDTSAVLSDFISADDYKLTGDEELSLSVNGFLRQKEKISMMLFPPVKLVEYISSLMTLEEGDIIFTGTPKGVGQVKTGDIIEAKLDELVSLKTEVTSELFHQSS